MRQVYTDYSICIHPHDVTIDEIRFFYNPMIESICEIQKKSKGKGK
jgi:hypothetical protein